MRAIPTGLINVPATIAHLEGLEAAAEAAQDYARRLEQEGSPKASAARREAESAVLR